MKNSICYASLLIAGVANTVWADFSGPTRADNAASPDGNLVVRIEIDKSERPPGALRSHVVRYYEFDASKDSYVRRSEFRLNSLGQLLFVSNGGDLVMISLGEKEAIRLYAKDGKLVKAWGLDELLIPSEIEACAQTGATLQWLEEGAFFERSFYFKGPSLRIRALQPPFTVMRGANAKVSFSGTVDAKTGKLQMDKPEEP